MSTEGGALSDGWLRSPVLSPHNKRNATVNLNPSAATANQRGSGALCLRSCPISVALSFVVDDDIRTLLLLPEAAESRRWEPDGVGLCLAVLRSPPESSIHFLFCFVLFDDFKLATRRVDSRHVGEYGRTQAPGDDKSVCFDGRLRRRPGEAAAPGGPLAVRDGVKLFFPGGKHPQSPPPDDVHPQKHSCHTT